MNKKHGGKRPNSGRKKIYSGNKSMQVSIELYEYLKKIKGNKSFNQYLIDLFSSIDSRFFCNLEK